MQLAGSVILVLGLCAGVAWPVRTAAEDPLVPSGKRARAPKLALRDLDGQKRQLSQLAGQTVVVNFWATWCAPCRAEMPEFSRVHSAYRDRGVEFVGAANERRSERHRIREFARRLEIAFPIWLEASLDHMEAFGVGPGLPATVIVDPQGRIAVRIKGPTDAAQLQVLLDRILLEATRGQP